MSVSVNALRTSVVSVALLVIVSASAASAQEQRGIVFGEIGVASIGHADSTQGTAPIIGGGAAFHPTPRLLVEGDVHGARVRHVFGRDHHDFTELTVTGSLLFRTPVTGRVHLLAGGGFGLQRAHSEFEVPPIGLVDQTETIGLWHGRVGAEFDVSPRVVIRTDGVLWFGTGLDWITGARIGVGYRF